MFGYMPQILFPINLHSKSGKIAEHIAKDRNLKKTDTLVTVQDPFECGLVGMKIKKKLGMPLHVQIHTDFLNPFLFRNLYSIKFGLELQERFCPTPMAYEW